jgi:UTP--glucose-1-phosphate uridylyltransferase
MQIKKAVIPAAGFGTRFLPFTKASAKELLPIIDRPALDYIVREAIDSGIKEILIIISPLKEEIKKYFGRNIELEEFLTERKNFEALDLIKPYEGVKIEYVIQYEQLGLGHAILHAKEFTKDEPFAVLLGDDIFYSDTKPATKELIEVFNKYDGHILATMTVALENTNRYGICMPKPNQKGPVFELLSIVEKPDPSEAPSQIATNGRYILKPSIYKYLEVQEKGTGGEIQLTDAILNSMEEEKVFSYDVKAKRYDVGSKEGYVHATIDFALRRDDLREHILKIIKELNTLL